ncbi:MAG: TonB-dependent receptor, partial [Nonlabens sp.]|nr:TonB-dependent receptor [Nonlabens sp.]
VSNAQAIATHVLYKAQIGNWTVTPGLRNETIKLTQDNYGSNDVNRTGANLSSRENDLSVWIPGIGAHYTSNQNLSFFGGIHKGFSPPGSSPDVDEEESVNYELGTRFVFKGIRGEVTGFFNNYSNLLGSDLAASGGGGTTDMFNAGAAHVSGLEISFTKDILENNANWSFPITVNYTLTNTSFQNEFDSDIYGDVSIGDEIPYIAKNQWNVLAGLGHGRWEFNTTARYVGEMRTQAGNGFIPQNQRIDSNFVIDASFRYNVNNYLTLTTNIINLFDAEYAVSRQPAGLRPGHPFGINAGFTVQL